jgi:hypothetical protein
MALDAPFLFLKKQLKFFNILPIKILGVNMRQSVFAAVGKPAAGTGMFMQHKGGVYGYRDEPAECHASHGDELQFRNVLAFALAFASFFRKELFRTQRQRCRFYACSAD